MSTPRDTATADTVASPATSGVVPPFALGISGPTGRVLAGTAITVAVLLWVALLVIAGAEVVAPMTFLLALVVLSLGIVASAVSAGKGLDSRVRVTDHGTVAIGAVEMALGDVDRFSIGPGRPGRHGRYLVIHRTTFLLGAVCRDGTVHTADVSYVGDVSYPGVARNGAEAERIGNQLLASATGRPTPAPSPLAQVILDRVAAHESGDQPWRIRWGRLAAAVGLSIAAGAAVFWLVQGSTPLLLAALLLPPLLSGALTRAPTTADQSLQASMDALADPWRTTGTLPDEPPVQVADQQGPRIPYWIRGAAIAYWLVVVAVVVDAFR